MRLFFTLLLLTFVTNAAELMPVSNLWKSETFRKAFTASYAVSAPGEPHVNGEEQAVLDSVADSLERGNRDAAIGKLQESLWLKQSPVLQFTLGSLLVEAGRAEEAVPRFGNAIDLYPDFRDAHRNRALALIQLGKTDDALPGLTRAIELGAHDGLTYGLLGYCHSSAGRDRLALAAYRQAELLMPDELQWTAGEAFALLALERADDAAALLGDLLKLQPENDSLWLAQSDAWMMLEQYDNAIANREFLRRRGRLPADGLLLLGHLYLNEGLPDDALGCYRDALAASPEPSELLAALERLIDSRHWKQAQAFAEKMTPVPENLASRFERDAALIELEAGDPDAGVRRVEEIVARDPMDFKALVLLARAYRKAGRPEEAVMRLEQAAGNPDTELEALRLLGQVQAELGKTDESLKALRRAAELRPDPALDAYIAAVKNLKGGE
jgi:tetratricopeptide (TPR) repeat protein